MGLSLATAAFWLFLAVVVGMLIWRKGMHRREVLITLRAAIEKGVPLDDERLQALLGAAAGNGTRQIGNDFFMVLGAILGGSAVCLGVLALLGSRGGLVTFLAISTGIMAATMLVLWRIFVRRAQRAGTERR